MSTKREQIVLRVGVVASLLAITWLLSACASAPKSHSGFIGEELDFRAVDGRENAYVWVNPLLTPADAERYHKLMLDPIAVWYSPDSPYKGIHPEELKILTDYLHRALVVELSDQLPLTDRPGEDVLRLRVAITDLMREHPTQILTQRPGGLALSGIRARLGPTVMSEEELLDTSSFFLAGSLEAELLDSMTGERLGAFVESRAAQEGDTGTKPVTWGRVRDVLDEWAMAIRDQLDLEVQRLKAAGETAQ
jgi:hypothetical protein